MAPVLTITMPTTSGSFATEQSFVTIGGTASDAVGVRGVEWQSDRGGSGAATGTQSWLAAVPLMKGPNTITVRAFDAAGNSTVKKIYIKLTKLK